ncbi:MAG: hypothetical protein M1839_000748 [Geoglossum umbratile]|nr:MAG: hypothetical protein M1839_000748 [Geoglossum umbratile]
MTDISHPLITQTAPHQLDPINAHAAPPTPSTTSHDFISTAQEDESYTIKCICPFPDDDGSTVYCEQCRTWQHIECYYPSVRVPEIHHCTDCGGTKYDAKAATERQKRKRELTEVEKPKRPAGKSHKKKPRDPKPQSSSDKPDSGNPSDGKSTSPRDQPPNKKAKTSHKNSNSMGSHVGIQSPSLGPSESRRVARALSHATRSPSKSPPPSHSLMIDDRTDPPYTFEFMQLYKRDPGDKDVQANVYSSLDFLNQLQSWLSDPTALRGACGASPSDVFQRHQSVDSMPLPHIKKRKKEDHGFEYFGSHPTWMFLTVDSYVPAGSLLGELKGEMGHLGNYKNNERNRWKTLQHPEPFVFFHPQLPMYIDTRKEGNLLRYVRRSCRPNLEMKVLVTNNRECHICFIAAENILPDSELTIEWEYPPHFHEYFNHSMDHDSLARNDHFQSAAQWTNSVIANFGGCACEGTTECRFSKFISRQNGVAPFELGAMQTNGNKSRKQKRNKNHMSLYNGTVPTANSRASSEGPRHPDHRDEHDDSQSTSGSVNSKSRSRDLTPATHFSGDIPSALTGIELSDREKRKIAAVEKTFERLDEGQGQKKKKRVSGASISNGSGVGAFTALRLHRELPTNQKYQKQCTNSGPHSSVSLPNTPALMFRGGYTDASTGRTQSGSPTSDMALHRGAISASPTKSSSISTSLAGTPRVSSPVARPNYQNASTQTDPEDDAWYSMPPVVLPRKRPIPYAQRLLERCQEDRSRFEMEQKRKSDAISVSNGPLTPLLNIPFSIPVHTGGQNFVQEPKHLKVEEQAVNMEAISAPPPPVDVPPDTVMADSGLQDSGSHASPSSAIQPLDPNIQKMNTPNNVKTDPALEGPSRNAERTTLKAPHSLVVGNGTSTEFRTPNSNVHRPTNLQLQSLPLPQLNNNSPATPSTQGPLSPAILSAVQSPCLITKLSPSFARGSAAQASPAKKKLSLSEYASQRKKVETPTAEKSRFSFEGTALNHSSSGPPVPSGTPRPPIPSLVEEAKASGGLNGSAIVDSP